MKNLPVVTMITYFTTLTLDTKVTTAPRLLWLHEYANQVFNSADNAYLPVSSNLQPPLVLKANHQIYTKQVQRWCHIFYSIFA